MSPTTYQTPPRPAASLAARLCITAVFACLLMLRSASAQTLQFRYTFEDSGTTTTTNNPSDPIYPLPMNLISGSGAAASLHGPANSGIQNQGHALNLVTNPIGGNAVGSFAVLSNSATLGQLGTVTDFTATVWIKLQNLETNISNQGSRIFELLGNGVADIGGTNALGLQFQLNNNSAPCYPTLGIVGLVSSASKVSAPIYYQWPTNVWIFLALTYNSTNGNESIYYGTEASPAKLFVVKNIGAGTNFNFSGTPSFALGNRLAKDRSFPGWLDDARFYTGCANNSFIESVRQSATPLLVTGLTPDGSVLMDGTDTLTFTATSAGGVSSTGVKVAVNGTDVSSSLKFTPTTGGQIVTYTNLPVNPMLTVQTNLNAVSVAIQVTDNAGIVTTNQYLYDAFTANQFTFEAEDYDFNGGQYADNSTYAFDSSDPFYQQFGVPEIDVQDNGGSTGVGQNQVYRSSSDVVATEFALGAGNNSTSSANGAISLGELMRQKILDANALNPKVYDVDVNYFDYGASTTPGLPNWMNYTRTFPTNVYNVYIRTAFGSPSGGASFSVVNSGWGTWNQTSNYIGSFSYICSYGWEQYAWVPLKDTFGNLIRVSLGGTNTIKLAANNGGGGNVNFVMFTPANTNLPAVSNVYPNGTNQFQNSSALTFTVGSPAGYAINTNSIKVQLTVTTLSGLAYVTNITATNGLTFTGAASSWNVSCPLKTNAYYSVLINATDVNGGPASSTVSFDTYNPSYIWEAEDYDYNNGQYIDNGGIGAYANQSGVTNVDYHSDSGSSPNTADGGPYYRNDGISTQPDSDTVRLSYVNSGNTSYYVGWFDSGNWCNYTHKYPAGAYNVFIRAADGAATAGSATLAMVTAGVGTSNQTLSALGSFTIAATGGWQTYATYPLRDASGNLVKLNLTGAATTLRLTSAGNLNVDYLMLAPADTTVPALSSAFPDGTAVAQSTNTFSFNVSAPNGVATNKIVVTVNGVVVPTTNLQFTGSSINWTVGYHLQPCVNYLVTVSVTDNLGYVVVTKYTFDTFSIGNNYTWEAEDFDFNGGQFIDNPQTNAYFGVNAITNVDYTDINTAGGTHWTSYRTNGMETEINGDSLRPQYNGTGYSDYSVGYFTTNEWMNFTRHYPAGAYNVYGRMATAGGATSSILLAQVTGGWGTATQTTNYLGSFTVTTNAAWETYSFYPLTDASGNKVTVTFNGSTNTLQVIKGNGPDINVNFFMLVPLFKLSAVQSSANVALSFPTQSGFKYQVQYKSNLADAAWSSLGAAVAGDNTIKSVLDPLAGSGTRFYRVQVQ